MTAANLDDYIGTTLDRRFQILRLIGRGGMGAVFEAHHIGLERRVAIKFLLGDRSPDMVARFQSEARAASRVEHDNVIHIYDVDVDERGNDFIVMEYLEGRDLRRVVQDGPLPVERAVRIGAQILAGLHAIHENGIVHRDIKPANILLTEQAGDPDFVKIMDFGISKAIDGSAPAITKSGHVVGTPQYMSPEQLLGDEADRRSDVYAAGLTIYELIAGAAPFVGGNTAQITAQHLAETPRPLANVPPHVAYAIERALAKRANERFATAAAFSAALTGTRGHATGGGDSREAVTVSSRPAATARAAPRRPWALYALAALLVSAVPVAVYVAMRDTAAAPKPTSIPAPTIVVAPADAATSPAEQHLIDARDAERAGQLEVALDGYRAAYEAEPTPVLLFQIGALYERVGKPVLAVEAYRRYLDALPTASDAAHVRTRIAALDKPVAAPVHRPSPPKATGRYCRCFALADSFTMLCSKPQPRLCRCEAMGGMPLCSEPPPFRCDVSFTGAATLAEKRCNGWTIGSNDLVAGRYGCSACPQPEVYRGENQEACSGIDRYGRPVKGSLGKCQDTPF